MGVIACHPGVRRARAATLFMLHWRGRGVAFTILLLVQIVPFQLLMIPLYVLIARGLSDWYAGDDPALRHQLGGGAHLPAVLPAVPRTLFDAARIDGGGCRVLWSRTPNGATGRCSRFL